MDDQSTHMAGINRLNFMSASPALIILAELIEQGKVKEEDWKFLTYMQNDEVDTGR